jgi:quercetin dioxygenase-like cupin family protein
LTASSDNKLHIGQLELDFLVDENVAPGTMVMFEFTVPAGAKVPVAHYHREVDEAVYVLEGTFSTTRDGERHDLRPGQSLHIPRGAVHVHENFGQEKARALIVMTPATIGRAYFEEMAAAVGGPNRPDPALITDIMLRYGLVAA